VFFGSLDLFIADLATYLEGREKLHGCPWFILQWLLLRLHRQARQIERMKDSPTHVDAVAGLWDGLRGKGGASHPTGMASHGGTLLIAIIKLFFPPARPNQRTARDETMSNFGKLSR
jgi:hypothetical protein